MKTATIVLLSLLVQACFSAIDTSCQPTLTQSKKANWRNGNQDFSQWEVTISSSSSSISSLSYSVSSGSFFQVWELIADASGNYELPTWRTQFRGGIPKGDTHTAGYITAQDSSVVLTLTSLVCSSSSPSTSAPVPPTSAPVPPTSAPVPPTSAPVPPTSAPVPPTSAPVPPTQTPTAYPPTEFPGEDTIGQPGRFPAGVCSTVVVIDNYIVRYSTGQTTEQIKQKYAAYFADVQKYYQYMFNIDFQFTFYVEEGTTSFTDTLDGGELLTTFSNSIRDQAFGNPTGQCLYHLLTGRQPYGIGGLAFVGSTCNDFSNTGLTVDGFANEDAELVIRRAIHEIGHNLGGDHPDRYTTAPAGTYDCSVGEDRADDRILRSSSVSPNYQYLSQNAFISECAVNSIRDSLSAFTCLYPIYATNPVYPQTILCEDTDAEKCHVVQSYNGDDACYNILAFNDAVSSLQVFPGKETSPRAVGIALYADVDCRGAVYNIYGYYSPSLPSNANDQASSFKFIVQ